LQLGDTGVITGRNDTEALYLFSNAYVVTGNTQYITSDFATAYQMQDGKHSWSIAPSGTAGNAITFTQAMTLDASGRLLVGTAATANNISSEQKLAVVATGSGVFPGLSSVAYSGTTATAASIVDIKRSRGTTDGSLTVVASGDDLGYLRWWGADGTAFIRAAQISAQVDGTPGTNDMPGRLVFSTTLARQRTRFR